MGQVKNNDSFLGKAEKLKPVLKHRMLRPVGVVSFERKKADSGADFWNTVGVERLGILSVMLSDEPLAYRGIGDCGFAPRVSGSALSDVSDGSDLSDKGGGEV